MFIKAITRWLGLPAIIISLALTGCGNDSPVSPGNNDDQEIEPALKNASHSSVKIYENLAAFNQIGELMAGANGLVQMDIPEFANPGEAKTLAKSVQGKALARLAVSATDKMKKLAAGDSLIWDVEFEENGIRYRSKLTYNRESDIARLYLVGFEFPENHHLNYDSVSVEARLNTTLIDDSDDVLLAVTALKRYKAGQLLSEEHGSFVPDDYVPGAEPAGGVLRSDITYGNSSFISGSSATFEYHTGEGGSYSKESRFSDGSVSKESAAFREDGTGSFSEQRRDGTTVEGEFDSADPDGQGSFLVTTTYPAGHDPVSVRESGSVSVMANSTLSGTFEREIRFLSGDVDRESVSIAQTRVGEVLTTTLNVENADGSHGHIRIVEAPDLDQVSGEWTNQDGTFQRFTAECYSDNSAHLEFQLYASQEAFENGEDPTATGAFDFYPDGSGKGVITEGDQEYDVTIRPDGTVIIEPRG